MDDTKERMRNSNKKKKKKKIEACNLEKNMNQECTATANARREREGDYLVSIFSSNQLFFFCFNGKALQVRLRMHAIIHKKKSNGFTQRLCVGTDGG